MAEHIKLRLNIAAMAAIKRVDPYVRNIDDNSRHVAVHTFNLEEKIWQETDFDAAFFIYSRNAEPYRSIFIENKLNHKSLVEPITAQTEYKIEPPFLFFRNDISRGRCFRFQSTAECNRIATLVQRIVQNSDNNSYYDAAQHSKQMNNGVDMFSILTKAQEDFNNSNASKQPDMSSQSVTNFFAAARPKPSKEIPIFKRMSSQPIAVNQIEVQHRLTQEKKKSAPQTLLNITKNLVGHTPVERRLGANFKRVPSPEFGKKNRSISNLPTTTAIQSETAANEVEIKPKPILKQPLQNVEKTLSRGNPRLMSPIMFSVTKHSTDKDSKTTTIPEAISTNGSQMETIKLVQFAQPNKAEPLTQGQLLQAMSYLIRNDSSFVKKLHEAYLNYVNESLCPIDIEFENLNLQFNEE